VICHGKRGQIQQPYRDGQEDQLAALGLVLNAVTLWTTRYLDAAVTQLRAQGVAAADVERVELRVHPLVLELTGKKEPQDGLQGKFSVYQGFALGLVFGRAGESEYTDEIVRREDIVALRRKVEASVDRSIDEAAADVTVTLKGGAKKHVLVEHAIGSLARPMSDADLEAKFHGLADPVIGAARAKSLIEACWNLARAKDVRALCEGARA
jgi:2-methylcitrate dehydratase PrpD